MTASKPAPVSNRAAKASIHAVMGATGTAKTTHVMRCLKRGKPGRLMVWDAKGEFAREGYGVAVRSMAEVARILVEAGPGGKFAICYQPHGERDQWERDFSRFCNLAFHAKNLWLIAEELSNVTRAGSSPQGWTRVSTQGRTEGVTVYGLSQSPALMDKTFLTNCTSIRTGRLNSKPHAKVMAEVFNVPPEEIMSLEDGHYMHITFSPRSIKRGNIFAEK